MTLRARNQVLCNVWSYDFYDMMLVTESQQMINKIMLCLIVLLFTFHSIIDV